MNIRRLVLLAAFAATALIVGTAGSASAHVTVQPKALPADSYTRIAVRVPNESDKAATTKVEVSFPEGIYSTSYEPVPGWKTTIKQRKLDQPVEAGHGSVDSETDVVTFTATGPGIKPGEFQDFGLSIRTPDKAGEELKFPAVQTYDDGEVVRWIGAADSEHPAATATLEAAAQGAADDADKGDDGSGTSTVAWIALVLGALGLATGLAALTSGRRRA